MDLQPIDYDPIYLETIGGQKKQQVYDIGSKGVAFCSSSCASSSSVTATVDEAVEQRVMETNERIAVMETKMKEKDQQIILLKDEMQQMKEVNNEMKEMKNAIQQQMTNMQSQLAALMLQMGHRVPAEHPPVG